MSSFSTRALYGGAITTLLPTTLVDSSTLRQVPDHQEVYLSPQSFTSVVFEINEFVSALTISQQGGGSCSLMMTAVTEERAGETRSGGDDDAKAALYHLDDLVDAEDTLTIISAPQHIQLQTASLSAAPALIVRARLTTTEKELLAPSVLPEAYQHNNPELIETTTTIRLLLVRLPAQATDLCVVINVPWKGMEIDPGSGSAGRGKIDEEEAFADAVLENVVKSLEVRDFGLFGG
jgi:Ran-interacting Mog1 protein